MKRYFQYIALACLAFALNSCIKDEFVGNSFCRDSQLTLNLSLGDLTRTGTPNNGIGEGTNDDGVVGDPPTPTPLNENKITRVEIYLYPTGSESSDAKFAYAQDITANDKVENLNCTVPAGALNDLFGSGTSCSAYVVVNYKNETVFDTDNAVKTLAGTSIAALKQRVVEADFTATTTIEVGWVGRNVIEPQDSFVMDSDIATITKTDNALSGTVYVTRAAAKITFTASIPATLKVDGVKWTPKMENLTVAFKNLATNSLVDNGSDTSDTTDDLNFPADNPAMYAGVSGIQLYYGDVNADIAFGFEGDNDVEGVEDGWIVANIVVPFYTYSNFWTEKANNEPAITLSVPWYVDGKESSTLTTYTYTVPFNIDATTKQGKFVRNKHYQYNLRVGVLGDLVELGTSEFSYEVLNWIGENTIYVQLQKPTYLVVEKDYVEVFNENSYGVNYSSSDSITAEIVSIIKPDYSERIPIEDNYIYGNANSDSGSKTVNGSGFSGNTENFVVDVENGQVVLKHNLNNNMENSGFDYVPYTVKVKVTMKAGTKTYVEYITFKQYPAMYVYADTNESFDTDENDNSAYTKNNDPRNTFVNGLYSVNSDHRTNSEVTNEPTRIGNVNGLQLSTNANPNQYVLTVSSFTSDQKYVIADPRSRTSDVSGLNIGTIANSLAVDYNFNKEANKRTLQNYYRTIEDRKDGSTNNSTSPDQYVTGWHIAPKYRIASSYSVVDRTSCDVLAEARRRCATYQENGYPAGRWRLATYAEIQLIVSLSYRGIIPELFTSTSSYWCAHGYVKGDGNGKVSLNDGDSGVSVRCVYDEWYWGKERLSTDTSATLNYTQFVWGDMKIW